MQKLVSVLSVLVVLAAGLLSLAVVAVPGAPAQGTQGSLSGRVTIWPLCPIEPCQKPDVYSVRRIALQPKVGKPIFIKINPDGTFAAKVNVGTYKVYVTNCIYLGCKYVLPQRVSITADHETTLDIRIDTGIR